MEEEEEDHLAGPDKHTLRLDSTKILELLLNFSNSNSGGQVSHVDRFVFTNIFT